MRRIVQNKSDWDLYLAKAIYDINNRIVDSIKMSPLKAPMGFMGQSAIRKSFKDDKLFGTTGNIQAIPAPVEGELARLICRRESLREFAYKNRMVANEKMKRYYDKSIRVKKFKQGE